jgi:hypothetical protein
MKERPILMNDAMVRATLREVDPKGQTRRVVKPQPIVDTNGEILWRGHRGPANYMLPTGAKFWCPYGQPGDRLIVAKEIPGVSKAYCAGSNGIVYSRARGEWRPLKPHTNGNGYQCVTIMDGARKTTRAVHSLVCSAFYGPPPSKSSQVRHLNGDTTDNAPLNLAWGSQQENWLDRRSHGNGIEGEKHHAAKFTDEERAHICWAIEKGLCSKRGAARTLGIAQSTVQQMLDHWSIPTVDETQPETRIPPLLLEITAVRVERVRDISEADAIAEGIKREKNLAGDYGWLAHDGAELSNYPRNSFAMLWSSIHGPDAWARNDWIWVIEFKRLTP